MTFENSVLLWPCAPLIKVTFEICVLCFSKGFLSTLPSAPPMVEVRMVEYLNSLRSELATELTVQNLYNGDF